MAKGRVLRSTGSWYLVKLESGEDINCRIKGKLRLEEATATNPVAVGDYVEVELEDEEEGIGTIKDVLPRDNYMVRESPRKKFARHILAANLDQAFIIATLKNPNIKQGFIDRFLAAAEAYHVPPVIIFNKMDLLKPKDMIKLEDVVGLYREIGYQVLIISALTGYNLEPAIDLLKDKTTLIAGHSGVGKSSFLNAIHPELGLKTADISNYTGKGIHTTTFATMFELSFGGYVVDTPGIKELSLLDIEPEELSHYFPEMRELLSQCQFNNCLHMNEPGCAVKEAVQKSEVASSRYFNYLNILDEIQQRNKWDYNKLT